MEVTEPIYVTDQMLARWGACGARHRATTLFADGRIPVTPAACDRLLAAKLDVLGWMGGILSGVRRRAYFRLAVEADLRTRLAEQEPYRALAAQAALGKALMDKTMALRAAGARDEAEWIDRIYYTLCAFHEGWNSRRTVENLASYYARLNYHREQHISLNEATRQVFALICVAVYRHQRTWREQPRDPRGRFLPFAVPPEHNAAPLPRLPMGDSATVAVALTGVARLYLRPEWAVTGENWLVSPDNGQNWLPTGTAVTVGGTALPTWNYVGTINSATMIWRAEEMNEGGRWTVTSGLGLT